MNTNCFCLKSLRPVMQNAGQRGLAPAVLGHQGAPAAWAAGGARRRGSQLSAPWTHAEIRDVASTVAPGPIACLSALLPFSKKRKNRILRSCP
jgi:hypothetical protein